MRSRSTTEYRFDHGFKTNHISHRCGNLLVLGQVDALSHKRHICRLRRLLDKTKIAFRYGMYRGYRRPYSINTTGALYARPASRSDLSTSWICYSPSNVSHDRDATACTQRSMLKPVRVGSVLQCQRRCTTFTQMRSPGSETPQIASRTSTTRSQIDQARTQEYPKSETCAPKDVESAEAPRTESQPSIVAGASQTPSSRWEIKYLYSVRQRHPDFCVSSDQKSCSNVQCTKLRSGCAPPILDHTAGVSAAMFSTYNNAHLQASKGQAARDASSDIPCTGMIDLRPSSRLAYPELRRLPSIHAQDSKISPDEAAPADERDTTTAQCLSAASNGAVSIWATMKQPACGPRGFHIPPNKFKDAINAESDSAGSFWQYTLYQGPAGAQQRVKVHYCKNKQAAEEVAKLFLQEKVIGFDIEWIPQAKASDGIKRNVSLIQLASEERIALLHLARYPSAVQPNDFISPSLKQLMESPDVTKVGVAIQGDCTRLQKFLGITCQGLLELSHLYKLVKYCEGNLQKVDRRPVRLADQVNEHLLLPLLKGEVQVSNWACDLTYQQTQYAASDTYAGLQLFFAMEAKRKSFTPIPPRPAHAELGMTISLGGQARDLPPMGVAEPEQYDESSDSVVVSSSDSSIEELARDYFHIALDDNTKLITGTESPNKLSTTAPHSADASSLASRSSRGLYQLQGEPNTSIAIPSRVAPSFELDMANLFVATYKQPENGTVSSQALRAYALWHRQGKSINEVANILRTPAIQDKTVITYLCDVLCIGDLTCEPALFLDIVTTYKYQPFLKSHKDLLDRLRKDARLQ